MVGAFVSYFGGKPSWIRLFVFYSRLSGKSCAWTLNRPLPGSLTFFSVHWSLESVALCTSNKETVQLQTNVLCHVFVLPRLRLGAVCPSNYNPADFFIQMLAVVPTREETSRQTIDMVCDAFQTSEAGRRIIAESGEVTTAPCPMVVTGCNKQWPHILPTKYIFRFNMIFWIEPEFLNIIILNRQTNN